MVVLKTAGMVCDGSDVMVTCDWYVNDGRSNQRAQQVWHSQGHDEAAVLNLFYLLIELVWFKIDSFQRLVLKNIQNKQWRSDYNSLRVRLFPLLLYRTMTCSSFWQFLEIWLPAIFPLLWWSSSKPYRINQVDLFIEEFG